MSSINLNSGGYQSYGTDSHDGTGANSQPFGTSTVKINNGDIIDPTHPTTAIDEAQSDPYGSQDKLMSTLIEILMMLVTLLMQLLGISPDQKGTSSTQGAAPVGSASTGGGGGVGGGVGGGAGSVGGGGGVGGGVGGGGSAGGNAPSTPSAPSTAGAPTGGFANDWHTVRFSNTTNEPIVVHLTMGAGDTLPPGVRETGRLNGEFTIPPGQSTDITFAPGSKPNFRSTKGDGSVWNQGEMTFDEAHKEIYFDMSYIYGANSNMRMYSSDGKHSGYLGDVIGAAPGAAKVGNWGIAAPYNRFVNSNDPNNPDSAAGGPNGAKNAGAAYLYSVLKKGEGYVGRGLPVEVTDYDDASTLKTSGKVSVVF
jgi:hypothetical protein